MLCADLVQTGREKRRKELGVWCRSKVVYSQYFSHLGSTSEKLTGNFQLADLCKVCITIFRMAAFSTALGLIFFLIPYCIVGQGSEAGTDEKKEGSLEDIWIVRLCLNLMGYATIFVPGAILIRYLRQSKYNETAGEPFFFFKISLWGVWFCLSCALNKKNFIPPSPAPTAKFSGGGGGEVEI